MMCKLSAPYIESTFSTYFPPILLVNVTVVQSFSWEKGSGDDASQSVIQRAISIFGESGNIVAKLNRNGCTCTRVQYQVPVVRSPVSQPSAKRRGKASEGGRREGRGRSGGPHVSPRGYIRPSSFSQNISHSRPQHQYHILAKVVRV